MEETQYITNIKYSCWNNIPTQYYLQIVSIPKYLPNQNLIHFNPPLTCARFCIRCNK